jgi:hypothetical protein
MPKGEKWDQQRFNCQANPKPIQHHGGDIYMVRGLSYEHGNLGEIQYIWVSENEGSKKHPIF